MGDHPDHSHPCGRHDSQPQIKLPERRDGGAQSDAKGKDDPAQTESPTWSQTVGQRADDRKGQPFEDNGQRYGPSRRRPGPTESFEKSNVKNPIDAAETPAYSEV